MKLEYKPVVGDHIERAATQAIKLSQEHDGKAVKLTFNGCDLTVTADKTPEDVCKAYDKECTRQAEEYRNSPEGKLAAKAAQDREDQRAREKTEVDRKISGISMEFSDRASWDKVKSLNTDPYGAAAVRYAERWAKLMQAEMDSGKKLEDIIESTSYQADDEGMTGFMHGAARCILYKTWKYGKALDKPSGNRAGM